MEPPAPSEGFIPVRGARLYYRDVGRGPAVIVVHGGPDFDHAYLLPDLDRLAASLRLIYYDQRGRGRSDGDLRLEDIGMASEVADLETVRSALGLEAVALLGHSWGGLLAMEYALAHPERVSHLILMNSAPASRDGFEHFRRELAAQRTREELEAIKALVSSDGYAAGDPDVDIAYHRIHFRPAVHDPRHLERVLAHLRSDVTGDGIVRARAIEARLLQDSVLSDAYDLLPGLARLEVPTLVIHGDHDFVPLTCAARIVDAVPGARLLVLENCGHFAYLEAREGVERAVSELFADHSSPSSSNA